MQSPTMKKLGDIVRNNPELLSELRKSKSPDDYLDNLEKIGKQQGLQFSRKELENSIAKQSELSEDDLNRISAGGWTGRICSSGICCG